MLSNDSLQARGILTLFQYCMVALILICIALPVNGAIQCPNSALSRPKGNSLYLYFPTVQDTVWTGFTSSAGSGASVTPVELFDVADLDSGIGTTAQLRTRIFELVTDHYCEFNIDVQSTTTRPSPTEAQWQQMAFGTDSATYLGFALFGEAEDVDTGNTDAQDFGRVWAGSFGDGCGGTGEALDGTGSTLERWANAIAGTTSHEAGHNYGLSHGHSAPVTGSVEDAQNNHVLATGNTGLTCETRAAVNRHMSDTSYEILGHNVGLNIKTLHNWDFVNPNNTDAHSLKLVILSDATSLTIDWSYNGSFSPWTSPAISNTGTTQSFQGTTYNVFHLDFTTAKSWANGANGVAPPDVKFHVGATFSETADILVFETKLFDSGSSELPLHPRLLAYDAGTADLGSGDFAMDFINPNPGDGAMILRNIVVHLMPRMLDINSMMADSVPTTLSGLRVDSTAVRRIPELKVDDRVSLKLAHLTDRRTVDIVYGPEDCPKKHQTRKGGVVTEGPGDSMQGEIPYCVEGNALSLFPSTYVYITATMVDPNAYHWDSSQGAFVNGPVETNVFYQLAGFKPDFNNNGIDDLLDLREGRSRDDNGNGVPDEAEKDGQEAVCPCDLKPFERLFIIGLVLFAVLILVIFVCCIRKR